MRVGIYIGKIQDKRIGGGHTFSMSIIEGLMKLQSSHEFCFYYKSDKKLFEDTNNIKFVNMKFEQMTKIKKKLFFKKKKKCESDLNTLILKHNIELVYFITPAFEHVEAPFIFTLWDLGHRSTTHFPEVSINGEFEHREKMYAPILPKASYVVIGNNKGKQEICKYFNIDDNRVKTIPMTTPNYVYEENEDISILKKHNIEPKKYLFYPAQFWPHKNHIRLVKAIKKLKEQGQEFKLIFTGSNVGNENYIKQKVKEYNLENDILFLGFISKAEIVALYKHAFALTFASFLGPDNIPPLEAMALECPVIASGIDGMREQLSGCALFFNPTDENSLIEQLEKLKDENLRKELVQKGTVLAKSCCVDNYIEKMIEIIDDFAPIRECWSSARKYKGL